MQSPRQRGTAGGLPTKRCTTEQLRLVSQSQRLPFPVPSKVFEEAGGVSRARVFGAAQRTLDTPRLLRSSAEQGKGGGP